MTYKNQSGQTYPRRLRVLRRGVLVLAGFGSLTACLRPAEDLPEPPKFRMAAVRAPAQPAVPTPPPAPPPPAIEPFSGSTTVYFEGDSTELDSNAQSILDQQAEWLLRNPLVTASLQGHGDLLGSRARQFAVGEMRANAMRRHLVARGISPSRLSVTSFGKQQPIATQRDEESQRRNRRGETIFRGVAGPSEQ